MVKEIKLGSFRFLKQSAERNEDFNGSVTINPNINIKSIEKFKIEDSKQESLKIEFNFDVDYAQMGKISLEGRMFLFTDPKTMKETIEGWKNKKIDSEVNVLILNLIMQKSSVKALQLEEEIGLPFHVQLPKVQFGK
ncbi:Uncharacterised protein [uncultured archaeon]|nr:Uncharacterised protein [uncultured archaeon]